MRERTVNFSAGPAALPSVALERARAELLDYRGTGASIMELSHRGPEYDAVHHEVLNKIRSLLRVPESHDVLLLQGGASGMFASIPLNFLRPGDSADYILTGVWSQKALDEARRIGEARVAGSGKSDDIYCRIPADSDLDLAPDAAYVHLTSNNTIVGSQFARFPEAVASPLIADMSSDIMARPLDLKRFALVYAGAQKNLGPSGLVLVIARRSFLETGSEAIPTILRLAAHAEKSSLLHTPPTFSVYLVRNVLDWIEQEGGVDEMDRRSLLKSAAIYRAIDESDGFYRCPVETGARSRMNVVFFLPSPDLEERFLSEAKSLGFLGLRGHRTVGGIRASLYNAVPIEGVTRLVEHMERFQRSA